MGDHPRPRHETCPSREVVSQLCGDEFATLGSAGPAPLRVLLIDDGAHRVSQIHDEWSRLGHLVVGVIDSALLIHDCVLRLQPDVVIVDSDSPSRDTLEHLSAMSSSSPRPLVVFIEDASQAPMQQGLKGGISACVIAGLQPQRLGPALRVAIARFEQDRQLAMNRGQRLVQAAEKVVEARDLLKPHLEPEYFTPIPVNISGGLGTAQPFGTTSTLPSRSPAAAAATASLICGRS